MILSRCNVAGKHAIVARLVDTMAEAPRPTRAEATDVANRGVLDEADALLLGAETLRGNFASETVAMVRKICREAERFYDHESFYNAQISQRKIEAGEVSQAEALASSAVRAGDESRCKADCRVYANRPDRANGVQISCANANSLFSYSSFASRLYSMGIRRRV